MSDPDHDIAARAPGINRRRERLRWWLNCFWQQTARLIWTLVTIGLILRFTVRDRYVGLAIFYYMTPIAALPVWTLIAAISFFWAKRSRPIADPTIPKSSSCDAILQTTATCSDVTSEMSISQTAPENSPVSAPNPSTLNRGKRGVSREPLILLHVALGLVFVMWTYSSQCVDRALPNRPGDLQIVFWNAAHLPVPLSSYVNAIRTWNCPLIAMVEADHSGKFIFEQWARELPEYQVVGTRFGGLVAFKGRLKKHVPHQLYDGSWCDQFELSIHNNEFTLLLVDISSKLTLSREQPLKNLAALAESLNDHPVIIMGDFNTPDDSIWFDELRIRHRQAFRECGQGFAPTWPVPVPVLTLDQVWVNSLVHPTSCRLETTISSDHRAVISRLLLDTPQGIQDECGPH